MTAGRPREFDVDHALDQALLVFRQKGFEGASLPDLTDAMGISRPSLYAAFGNKESLFHKALDRYTEKNMVLLKTALAQPTARDAVRTIFDGMIDNSCGNKGPKGCLHVQGALACGDEAATVKEELARRRAQTELMLRQRFERAIADGDLPADMSATDLACYIATVIQGMSVQMTGGASPDLLRGVARMALRVFPA